MNPPLTWESKLWHRITCHLQYDKLNQMLLKGTPIIACSDAAVNTAKFSTFSWILYSDCTLWKGEGIVPGLVEDIYSGWLEAFGVLTTLCFLSNYLSNYPNAYPTTPVIIMYWDNKGVLDCINKWPVTKPLQLHTTTMDDFDIYITICATLQDLPPVSIQFWHINGHQDQNSWQQQLSLLVQLNIECDKCTSNYLTMAWCLKPQPNPMIPQCYSNQIDGQVIVHDLQASLHNAALTLDYHNYMQKKHNWTPHNCENVNWISLKFALDSLTAETINAYKNFSTIGYLSMLHWPYVPSLPTSPRRLLALPGMPTPFPSNGLQTNANSN